MAIDPNILLQNVAPDTGQALLRGFSMGEAIRKQREEAALQPLRQQVLEAQVAALPQEARQREQENQLRQRKLDAANNFALAMRVKNDVAAGNFSGIERTVNQYKDVIDPEVYQGVIGAVQAGNAPALLSMIGSAQDEYYAEYPTARPPALKDTTTTIEKQLIAAGLTPGTPEFQAAILQNINKPSGTSITISDQGQSAEAKALGEARVKRYQDISAQADSAMQQRDMFSQLKTLDIKTGVGEQTKADIASVFNALGLNGDRLLNTNVSNAQAYNKITGSLVQEGLMQQKGVATDMDARLYKNILPSIQDDKLANQFTIDTLSAQAERKVERSNFYNDWLDKKGNLNGADQAWSKYLRETPLFQDGVVDNATGLPANYYQFRQKSMEVNPGIPEEEVKKQWLSAPSIYKAKRGGV